MLSAQCDELRAMAESVGLAMPQAATLMMGAADTIDRLDAENAKLRKLTSKLGILADSGLMGLDDKEFASIIDSAKELGVEW